MKSKRKYDLTTGRSDTNNYNNNNPLYTYTYIGIFNFLVIRTHSHALREGMLRQVCLPFPAHSCEEGSARTGG